MIKIYLDMDGVLVDFLGNVEKCQFFRKNGKIDWDKVIDKGPQFWNEIQNALEKLRVAQQF